jgi:hypothetical protein
VILFLRYFTKIQEVQALHPGEIDNNDLMDPEEEGELRKGLLEKRDYEILTEQAWYKLAMMFKVIFLSSVNHILSGSCYRLLIGWSNH